MSEYRCYIYFKICISLSGPIPSSVRVCVAPPGKVSFPRQSQAYRCLHGHIWASLLFSVASLIVTTIFWYFTEKIFIIFLALFLNDNLQKCSTRLYHKSPSLVTWERQNGFVWNSKTGGGGADFTEIWLPVAVLVKIGQTPASIFSEAPHAVLRRSATHLCNVCLGHV